MKRCISMAPTGPHAIAQGNALGIQPSQLSALKGRNVGRAFSFPPVPPLQGGIPLEYDSRGDAPGYRISPRWGGTLGVAHQGDAPGYRMSPGWGVNSWIDNPGRA